MPIKAAAKKALRQRVKLVAKNTLAKAELHSLRVKLRKLQTAGKMTEAGPVAMMIGKKMDKAVSRGIMKQNTVARLKSRMAKKMNAMAKK